MYIPGILTQQTKEKMDFLHRKTKRAKQPLLSQVFEIKKKKPLRCASGAVDIQAS